MLQSVLIAEPGSGSTTFVGLLYLAQTRLSTERLDSFRFSAPPEALARLSPIYAELLAGNFPRSLAPEDAAQIRLDMAYRPPPGWRPFRREIEFEPKFRAECRWVRAPFEAVALALEGTRPDPAMLASLTGPTTVIFVLDPSSDGPDAPAATSARDGAMERILQQLSQRRGADGGRLSGCLHPLFVITKLDALPDPVTPKISRRDLVDEDRLRSSGPKIGRSLLEALAPRTSAFCRSNAGRVDAPVVFFSYVRPTAGTGPGTSGLETQTLPDKRHEPVYPFSQYRGLIGHLGDLAAREA